MSMLTMANQYTDHRDSVTDDDGSVCRQRYLDRHRSMNVAPERLIAGADQTVDEGDRRLRWISLAALAILATTRYSYRGRSTGVTAAR